LLLLAACIALIAADNGKDVGPGVRVFDANGHFIGTLVDGGFYPTIYVPSLKKLVAFGFSGDVSPMGLVYLSKDCSGTAYIPFNSTMLLPLTIYRVGSGFYTATPDGNPWPFGGFAVSSNGPNGCYPGGLEFGPGGLTPVALTSVTLPFPVPLAQPLRLE
jgi:hypothetical protein